MKTPARLTGKEKTVAGQVDLVRLNKLLPLFFPLSEFVNTHGTI